MPFAVITENDVSQWDDKTGVHYHFPSRYLKFLQPGTNVIYYKGRLIQKKFQNLRLASEPHYFGIGKIGKVQNESDTKNYYADILDFRLFPKAVPFKINGVSLEPIPPNNLKNYYRNGVRPITENVFNRILNLMGREFVENLNDQDNEDLVSTVLDGGKKKIYTTVYERNKKLRDQAIRIHGYNCQGCGFNFKNAYGEWGEGYIHVHHVNPLSSSVEKMAINPETDLRVVCANCHSMIHRRKDKILSMQELKKLMKMV